MSLVLNIDTALDRGSICLSNDGNMLQLSVNESPKDHATWLHNAIKEILHKSGYAIDKLDAVAVCIGPGSYTGLRVGLSSAKGICYALKIPLLTVNTLEMIAFAVRDEANELICPMIDARRMEVFTALYNKLLVEELSPRAMLLDGNSFQLLLSSHKILFCGNGSKKLQSFISCSNACFSNTPANASHLAQLSFISLQKKEFADLIYTEPLYLKEFYSSAQK